MTYSKMILYLLTSTIVSGKIQSKSKDLSKNLNNFNEIKFLIIGYFFVKFMFIIWIID